MDTTGFYLDTIIWVENIPIQPGQQIQIDTTGFIHDWALGGLYYHRAYVQEHVYQEIYDHDVFLVAKAPPLGADEQTHKSIENGNLYSVPNPFNQESILTFSLDMASDVNLQIFDIRGRIVSEILSERLGPGQHKASFDATGLPSGIYVARLKHERGLEIFKIALIR